MLYWGEERVKICARNLSMQLAKLLVINRKDLDRIKQHGRILQLRFSCEYKEAENFGSQQLCLLWMVMLCHNARLVSILTMHDYHSCKISNAFWLAVWLVF